MYIIIFCISSILGLSAIALLIIGKRKYEKLGGLLSAIASVLFGFNINIPMPVIYPLNNETEIYNNKLEITITSVPFVKIYYSLDGSEPKNGDVYLEPIMINGSTTVSTRSRFLFYWSDIEKSAYNFDSILLTEEVIDEKTTDIKNNITTEPLNERKDITNPSKGEMQNYQYNSKSLEQHDKFIGVKSDDIKIEEYEDTHIILWKDPFLKKMLEAYYNKNNITYADTKCVKELYIWGNKFICSVLTPDSINIKYVENGEWYHRKDINIISNVSFNIDGIQSGLGNISTLEDLKYFSSLQTLNICFQDELDLSTLPEMNTLYNLFLQYDDIKNIDALTRLPNLVTLDLGNNNIQDIKVLNSLSYLEQFSADNNQITDLTPLRELKFMTDLSLVGNDVEDYSVVSFIPHIKK